MQYWKPQAAHQFVGDCMPFFHDGTFHLFYLLDEEHHRSRNGFGAHQWANATTTDLRHWQHHPLAIPTGDATAFDYLSICTGSTIFHDGVYHAFYATRRVAQDGTRGEHLCHATSTDGVHFIKDAANPIASPLPPYDIHNFRDPCVFRDDTGQFHMLVTACESQPQAAGRGGCLAHFVSSDLSTWEMRGPFLAGRPGRPGHGVAPECPDYFTWNGWHYLIWTDPSHATTYRMARDLAGPWLTPATPLLGTPMERVYKTAAFTGDRRIAVSFLASLADNRDAGRWEYAGNAIFREIIQQADGTLGLTWPAEMIPATDAPLPTLARLDGAAALEAGGTISIAHAQPITLTGLPRNARITLQVIPGPGAATFGLHLRGASAGEPGYLVRCAAGEGTIACFAAADARTLDNRVIAGITGLDLPFTLDIVLHDDIIDICVDGRACLCTRLPELHGDHLGFFANMGEVRFENVQVSPLR